VIVAGQTLLAIAIGWGFGLRRPYRRDPKPEKAVVVEMRRAGVCGHR
jgi:hypothetical protein